MSSTAVPPFLVPTQPALHHEHNRSSPAAQEAAPLETLPRHRARAGRRGRDKLGPWLRGLLLIHTRHHLRPLRRLSRRPCNAPLQETQSIWQPTRMH